LFSVCGWLICDLDWRQRMHSMHPWLLQCRDRLVGLLGVFGGFIQSDRLHDLPELCPRFI